MAGMIRDMDRNMGRNRCGKPGRLQ
jgi:hypothetical protein